MTGGPEPLAEALAGRYAIERELGRGGMATVYLARDPGASRWPSRSCTPRGRRARQPSGSSGRWAIAASLDHPLIVPLIDSGRAGGVLYYVMPCVSGESLFERLQRERRLPVAEALGIARDVATALGYAHERGVLHRDVKPENILLARGRALIADFGLARAIGAADYTKLTATGVIVGTIYYMSPEQLREEPDLDQGRTSTAWDACCTKCCRESRRSRVAPSPTWRTGSCAGPSAVRRLRPEVPGAVDEAIGRALAKARADRFRAMSEMLAVLPA